MYKFLDCLQLNISLLYCTSNSNLLPDVKVKTDQFSVFTFILIFFSFRLGFSNSNTKESKLTMKVKSLEEQLSQMKTELEKTKESNRQLMEYVQTQSKEIRSNLIKMFFD